MPLRKLKIADVTPFADAFEGDIGAGMADIGRTNGSRTIGLAIQTVAPGCLSSRRHKHVFREESLIVISGAGLLHHGGEGAPGRAGRLRLLGAGVPLDRTLRSDWTEERRQR